jgi:oligoendopeptidase F
MNYTANITKLPRHFIPTNFEVTNWQSIEPFFKALLDTEINTTAALQSWMQQLSELEAVINEDACWRQIKMTCNTNDKTLEAAFNYFCTHIQPFIQPYADALNKKLVNHPLAATLDATTYFTYLRSIKKSIDLFREENIPLQAQLAVMQQQFGVISGAMTVSIDGQEFTLQQAAAFLENPDRTVRESVYRKIQERRLQDKDALTELFNNLTSIRNEIAANAGFVNYTDYRFKELGRFDYTQQDCYSFHDAVKQHVVPLVKKIYQKKKTCLRCSYIKAMGFGCTCTRCCTLTSICKWC